VKYEVVLHGSTAVISEQGKQVRPDGVTFFSPEGVELTGPPLPFRVGFDTKQQAEEWARGAGCAGGTLPVGPEEGP
jgi:hypothetical protein